MGYTHYFYTKPELDKKQFKAFAKDVKALIAKANVPLAFEHNETDKSPEITDEVVRFNGHGEDGHETFMLTRETPVASYMENKKEAFEFCKTARKPYDKYVTACLLLAKKHFGNDIRLSSDGEVEDWVEGQEIVKEVLGQELEIKFG